MIVTEDNLSDVLGELATQKFVGFDTETFGLQFTDRLFSLILSGEHNDFYFNFYGGEDHLGHKAPVVLPYSTLQELDKLFQGDTLFISHNAGYDLQKLELEGVPSPKHVHCTYVAERIIRNDSLNLSLDTVAKKYGYEKDDTVEKYIKKNKLYTMVQVPGKSKRDKIMHYDQVPFDIIVRYGERDGNIHRGIGIKQITQHFPGLLQ